MGGGGVLILPNSFYERFFLRKTESEKRKTEYIYYHKVKILYTNLKFILTLFLHTLFALRFQLCAFYSVPFVEGIIILHYKILFLSL